MKKTIVFDTGPIISLTINNLLWILEGLKKSFDGDFLITPAVYSELIEKPLKCKRFKLEALQVLPYVTNNILTVAPVPQIKKETRKLLELANHCFKAKGSWINIVHNAEMEVLATALYYDADTIVIDERTTRHLIENPNLIAKHISHKTHGDVKINDKNIIELKKILRPLRVIRSVELVTIAYEKGLLDRYVFDEEKKIIPNLEKELLEASLWALKLNGCSVSENEIKQIIKLETQ